MSLMMRALAIEGRQPEDCLLVTFTRASTRELRARVRERLIEEINQLSHRQSEIITSYPELSEDVSIERLSRALRRIDTIEIQTIHGFAMRLINDFGPSVGVPSFPVETEVASIRQEVAIDCYRQLVTEHGAQIVSSLTGGLKAFVGRAELAWKPIDHINPSTTICPNLSGIESEFTDRKDALFSDIESVFALKGMTLKSLKTHCAAIEKATTRQEIPEKTMTYFREREGKFKGTAFD